MNANPIDIERYEEKYRNGKKLRQVTLCLPIDYNNNRILLAMKKRGFGAGRWNGTGGKLKPGESVEEAMLREVNEELGIKPTSYKCMGAIRFYFNGDNEEAYSQNMNIFVATAWEGTPSESDEMKPQWFNMDSVPFDSMWPDDKYWLNGIVSGKNIDAAFLFGENDKILAYKINWI